MSFKVVKEIAQNKRIIFALLYGFLALVVIYVMTSGGMGVSFDSEIYLTAASHLKQAEAKEAFKAAFPAAPIFYPLTVAMVPSFGLDRVVGAARIISIFSFVISVMMVFFLGLKIQGKPTAHLSALSLLVLAPWFILFPTVGQKPYISCFRFSFCLC